MLDMINRFISNIFLINDNIVVTNVFYTLSMIIQVHIYC